MDGASGLEDVGSGDEVSGWKWKQYCIFPTHRLAHPPIFDTVRTFNSIWVNKIWQLQQEQIKLHIVASKLFFVESEI